VPAPAVAGEPSPGETSSDTWGGPDTAQPASAEHSRTADNSIRMGGPILCEEWISNSVKRSGDTTIAAAFEVRVKARMFFVMADARCYAG
jgi:hypothetical protein